MFRFLWNSAWSLLILTNLFWAGNIVLARALSGHVPPIALAYWRWTGAFLCGLVVAWPQLREDLPAMLRHWKMMVLLGITGIGSYNTMTYIGLIDTTALNVLLLQSASPLIIMLWALALFREVPTGRQAAGILVSLIGVTIIAARGSLDVLLQLHLNPGDIWVLSAIVIYAFYSVMLRKRPAMRPLNFLVGVMFVGSMMNLPLMIKEFAEGAHITGGLPSYLGIAYTAVLPSFVSYLMFNRGIELIGAARAGQSMHLMPLFGSILAVLFLHEQFRLFHAAGIGSIALGIVLATYRPARRLTPHPKAT